MPRQTIQDLQSLAFHLADCHAATAERFGYLKSTSAYNKQRLGLICEDTASLLRLLTKPPYTPRDLSVFERLDEAAKTLNPKTKVMPTLDQLLAEGEEEDSYAIGRGYEGDATDYLWKGRRFIVNKWHTGKVEISEKEEDDEIYDIGAALDPKQAHDAQEEAKKK